MEEQEVQSARETLKLIEEDLIDLIQSTTHHAALELLTGALVRVRASCRYLSGDEFCDL